MAAVDAKHVEQSGEIVGMGVRARGQRRPAKPADVIPDNAVPLRERVDLVIPHPAVERKAVHEYHGVPAAGDLIIEARIVDSREPGIQPHRLRRRHSCYFTPTR